LEFNNRAIKFQEMVRDQSNDEIIIVDFMFADDNERKKCIKNLCSKSREDLSSVIENKHYTNIEELEKYIRVLGCKIHREHIVNFTWIVEIENKILS